MFKTQREDGQKLLETLRELAKTDIFIEAYLALAEVEVRAELYDGYNGVSTEYLDDTIVNKHLLKLVNTLIVFQTNRCRNYENEISKLISEQVSNKMREGNSS